MILAIPKREVGSKIDNQSSETRGSSNREQVGRGLTVSSFGNHAMLYKK